MAALLSVQLSPKEVERLISLADNVSQGVVEGHFHSGGDGKGCEIIGMVRVDLTQAEPNYSFGKLTYGPITAQLKVEKLWVEIDWHSALHIPKKLCLTIKDPCGHVIIDECVHFDLGVTKFDLFRGWLPASKFSPEVLDLSFVDTGEDGFDLKGDVPFVGQLYEVFLIGISRAALDALGSLVQQLLESVIGTSWLAKQIINILKSAFEIVDKAEGLVAEIIKTGLQPLDELLHGLFKDKLEIGLKKAAFPKRLTIMKAAAQRPPVVLNLVTPPIADLKASGLYVEVRE